MNESLVGEAYDEFAVRYAESPLTDLGQAPLARGMFVAFADLVRASGTRPILDLGCGPGHVTAHLRGLGCEVYGVDLSPEMIAYARAAHPELRFETGSMFALDIADGQLGGVLARYSTIHTPPERLPAAFAEMARVLAPGGLLLISFQAHDDPAAAPESFDHTVALAYRWPPDLIVGLLRDAGFDEVARLVISGREDERRGFPHAQVLARRVSPEATRGR